MTVSSVDNEIAANFSTRLRAALDSESTSASRVELITRALNHRLLNAPLCAVVLDRLLDEIVPGSDTGAVSLLNRCLEQPVVHAALISAPPLLRRLCLSACESRSSHQLTLSLLAFDKFPDGCLLDVLRCLLEILLTAAPSGVGFVDLITRLCACLDRNGRSKPASQATCNSAGRELTIEYLNSVLYNSIRVTLQCPSLRQPLFRLFVSMWLERACSDTANGETANVLSPARALVHVLYLADTSEKGAADVAAVDRLLGLLSECVSVQPAEVSGELMGWVVKHLLTLCVKLPPLPVLQFWTDWLGFSLAISFKPAPTISPTTLSSTLQPTTDISVKSECSHRLETAQSLPMRLLMFRHVLGALSGQPVPFTSSWRSVTLLQWLRAYCSCLLAMPSPPVPLPDQWYACVSQLVTITPHAVHWSTQLPRAMTTALTAVDRYPAADQLVMHVLSVYASLHQLPRLVPQLLLACRAAGCRRLLFSSSQSDQLAELVAQVPLPHVIQLLHTLVFHLENDVLKPASLAADTSATTVDGGDGFTATGGGEGGGDSPPLHTEPDQTEATDVVWLVLQVTSVLLEHAPIIDQNRVPSTVQKQLPDQLSAVAKLLRSVARAVCKTSAVTLADCSGGGGDRLTWLPLYIAALVSWRRCQSALLLYSDPYREQTAVAASVAGSADWAAPLTPRLLAKLSARTVANRDCHAPLWSLIVEYERGMNGCGDLSGCVLPSTLPLSPYLSALQKHYTFDALLQLVRAASHEQLVTAVKANGSSCRLQLAVISAVTRQLTLAPIKRRREDDEEEDKQGCVTENYQQLLVQLETLVSDMAQHSTDASREMLQKFLGQLSDFLSFSCISGESLRLRESLSHADTLQSLLRVIALFPLERSCTERAAVLMALLLLCWPQVPLDPSLLRTVLSAVTQPWPLLSLQLERLVPFIWLHCGPGGAPSLLVWLVACFPGRLTIHLTPLCDQVRTMLKNSSDRLMAAPFVAVTLPLQRHLVATWLTKRGKADARVSLKRQLKRLTGRVSRCISADLAVENSAILWSQADRLQLCSLIVQLPRAWSKHLENSALASLAGSAVRTIKRGGGSGGEKKGECDVVSSAWQFVVALCRASSDWSCDTVSPSQLSTRVWRNVAVTSATAAAASCCQFTCQQLHALLLALSEGQLAAVIARLLRHTRRLSMTSSSGGDDGTGGCWQRHLTAWMAVATCQNMTTQSRDTVQRPATNSMLMWLCHSVARVSGQWSEVLAERLCVAVETVSELMQQRCVALDESTCVATMLVCQPDLSRLSVSSACRVLKAIASIGFHAATTHAHVFVTRAPLLAQLVTFVAQQVCHIGRELAASSDQCVAEPLAVCERLERAVRELVGLGVAAQPLAPTIIADLLSITSTCPIAESIQTAIDACLVLLVGACRPEALTRLRGQLPPPSQLQLHTLVETYRRFYKFTGRV